MTLDVRQLISKQENEIKNSTPHILFEMHRIYLSVSLWAHMSMQWDLGIMGY